MRWSQQIIQGPSFPRKPDLPSLINKCICTSKKPNLALSWLSSHTWTHHRQCQKQSWSKSRVAQHRHGDLKIVCISHVSKGPRNMG